MALARRRRSPHKTPRQGRPLRALWLAGLLVLAWTAVRLPAAWRDAAGLAAAWQRHQAVLVAQASLSPARRPWLPAVPRRPPLPVASRGPPAAAPEGFGPIAADAAPLPALLLTVAPLPGEPAPLLSAAPPLRPPRPLEPTFQPLSSPAVPDILLDFPDAEPPSAEAFALASEAYARLAQGDRRGADRRFAAALLAGPHPNAAAWAADRQRLRRRWSGDVYTLTRAPGPVSAAIAPVLGGGQSGSTLAFAIDPLARRRLSVVVRNTAANDAPAATGQAAVGLRWQLRPGLSISAERLVALGPFARNGWTLRVAGGLAGRVAPRLAGRSVPVEWQAYGEAGVIDDGNGYGGLEARAAVPLLRLGKGRLLAGGGAWSGAQTGVEAAYRADVGPSLSWQRPIGRSTLTINADWRFRVAGNAFPESGPALTVAASF